MLRIPFTCACAVVVCLAWIRPLAAEEAPLRYKFQSGASLIFKVEIKADEGDEIEIQTGLPEFKVQSAEAQGAKLLLVNPQLAKRTERKPGVRAGIPFPRVPSFPGIRGGLEFQGHELTLDERGNVVQERGNSRLNYLLGSLAGLIFEPFPEKPQATWTRTERTTISIRESAGRIPSPFRDDREAERLTAEESTTFTIQETKPDIVTLKREHTIKTFEKTPDGPRLELQLSGTCIFDRTAGLPQDLNYDGKLISRKDNITYRAPLTISIHRLSDEELTKLREEQARLAAEAKARAEQAAAERKIPLSEEERNVILANLQDRDQNKVREALNKLKAKDAPPGGDKELAFNAAVVLDGSEAIMRHLAAEVLEQWGTADQVDALVKALGDSHIFVTQHALKTLVRLKDPKSYPAIIAKLKEPSLRLRVAEALKAIGSDAEPDVLKYLEHKDWTVRMEACNILKEIGTEKSLAALKIAAASDDNGAVKLKAKGAVEEVAKRAEK